MSNSNSKTDKWIISEEHKQTMSEFMADFWKLIKASYEIPGDEAEEDHYWVTLIRWSDALMKKYKADPVIIRMIMGYIDGQSDRVTGKTGSLPAALRKLCDSVSEKEKN
jgi:hypothetical protein